MKWKYFDPNFEYEKKYGRLDSAWIGHRYFAYDLIRNIKPDKIVELGTHKGGSLFCFAQAVKDQKIETKIFGIDTWQGDKHAGKYSGTVLNTVKEIKNSLYKKVDITLLQKTFDQALLDFDDNSIDILHIDGLHTYNAVKKDFQSWLPKLKKDGIILFHDTIEKKDDFGVYKLWEEIETKYTSFNFMHEHGLGVLFNSDSNPDFKNFFDIWIRYYELKASDYEIKNLNKNFIEQNSDITKLRVHISNLELLLDNIQSSKMYKFWRIFHKIRDYFRLLKSYDTYKHLFEVFQRYGILGSFKQLLEKREEAAYRENENKLHNLWVKKNFPKSSELINQLNESKSFKLKPKISIILPTYNPPVREFTICIESILGQSYQNWELCIADDHSSNNEVISVIKEYANKDHRIKYILRKKNGHISKASNSALKLATGEFIGLLDHDDLLWPNALYEVVKLLNNKPKTDFIYTDEDKIDLSEKHFNPHRKRDFSPETLLGCNYITHFAVIRKNIIDKIKGFRVGYEGSQDYDLFLRVTRETNKIEHIPKILYSWRALPESTASLNSDIKPYAYDNAVKALNDHLKALKIPAFATKNIARGLYNLNFKNKKKLPINIIIYGKKSNQKNLSAKYSENVSVTYIPKLSDLQKIHIDQKEYYLLLNSSIIYPEENEINQIMLISKLPEIALISPIIREFSGGKYLFSGISHYDNSYSYNDQLKNKKIGPYMTNNYLKIINNCDQFSLLACVLKGINFKLFKSLLANDKLSIKQIEEIISKQIKKKSQRIVTSPVTLKLDDTLYGKY